MNWVIITAVLGGAGALWRQLYSAAIWVKSLFIVSTEIRYGLEDAFMAYLWVHFWRAKSGLKAFNAHDMYVKPKGRYSLVAYESTGDAMIFFQGLRPLFLTLSKARQEHSQDKVTISYLRGTYDIEQLCQAAADFHNIQNEKISQYRRYKIRKHFGKFGDHQVDDEEDRKYVIDPRRIRPLGWDRSELGLPVDAEPFGLLYYDDQILKFTDHVRRWSVSRSWYEERGIPWRLGALLHGLPGTGKTSFVRAIAQELDMPIDVLDLVTLGNEELVHYWAKALENAPSLVLIEDMDRIFNVDKNIKGGTLNKPGLTMDCLLNCISGAEPSDGLLVLVTANDVDKMDTALTRPGRLDRILVFKELTEKARWKLAQRILPEHPAVVATLVVDGAGETGAQFTRRCTDTALDIHWSKNIQLPPGNTHAVGQ